MIKKVFHFADVHIRCESTRFDEYMYTFERLKQVFEQIDTTDSIAVIVGDLLHIKGKADVFAAHLLKQFLQSFPSDLPIYVVRGNHDVVQNRPNDPDLLSALLHGYSNVVYVRDTKCFKVDDIGFGVVDVLDVLEPGTSSGRQVDVLPDFPDPQDDVTFNIALYHGTIVKCKLQNYSQSVEGVPLSWFKGYDIAMLGDVHLRQIHVGQNNHIASGQLCWAYPGSMIQQNFGEEVINHGFLEWDLEKRRVFEHDLPGSEGFMKVKITNDAISVLNNRKWGIEEILSGDKCPPKVHFRIYGEFEMDRLIYLKGLITKYAIQSELTLMNSSLCEDTDDKACSFVDNSSIVNFNTQDNWIEHLKKHEDGRWDPDWEKFVTHPTTMKMDIPEGLFSKFIADKIDKKNEVLQKCIVGNDIGSFVPSVFKITHMTWSWLLCFGRDNHINFDDIQSYTTMICGNNAVGKTSFMECILIGLFGETSPGKSNSVHSAAVIHTMKPKTDKACVTINFEISGVKYTIHRTFRSDKNSVKIKESDARIISDAFEHDISGNRSVNEWVKSNICSSSDFLQTCMLCQSDVKDFFHMSSLEQLSKIESSQNMNAVNQFNILLDVSKKNLITSVTLIEDILADEVSRMPNFEESLLEVALEEEADLQKQIKNERIKASALSEKIGKFDSCDLKTDYADIERAIVAAQQKIDTIPVNYCKETLLIQKGRLLQIDDRLCNVKLSEIDVDKSTEFVVEYDVTSKEVKDLQHSLNIRQEEKESLVGIMSSLSATLRNLSIEKGYDVESDERLLKVVKKLLPNKSTIVRNIEKLELFIQNRAELIDREQKASEDLREMRSRLNEIVTNEFPFNPACDACKSQPWKLDEIALRKKILKRAEEHKIILDRVEVLNLQFDDKNERLSKNVEQLNMIIENDDVEAISTRISDYREHVRILCELTDVEKKIAKYSDDMDLIKGKIKLLDAILADKKQHIADHRLIVDFAGDIQDVVDLKNVDRLLEEMNLREELVSRVEYLRALLEINGDYQSLVDTNSKICQLESQIENLRSQIAVFKSSKIQRADLKRRSEFVSTMRSKYDTMCGISESFKTYRKRIFNDLLFPFICKKVNQLVGTISTNSSLSLSGELVTRTTKTRAYDEIEWFVSYDNSVLPIEKASGFQRSILSFAMMVTLNSINTALKNQQLFIDEGFVNFDQTHLSRVFDLLNRFKHEYKQIIMVSHLDDLKTSADFCIEIQRFTSEGYSKLNYGKTYEHEFSRKRGRPKKTF